MSTENDLQAAAPNSFFEAAKSCKMCGNSEIEPGYSTAMCVACRTKLVNRPIPPWIVSVACLCLLIVLIESFWFPKVLSVAVANERAVRAEKAGDLPEAVKQFSIVCKAYPNYDDGWFNLAEDSYHCGEYSVTVRAIDALTGRTLDQDQVDDLNQVQAGLNKEAAQAGGSTK